MANVVVTGEKTRISHVHVFEKFSGNAEIDPAFQVMVMIPKSDKETIKKIRDAEAKAIEEGIQKVFGGKKPANPDSIWKDGDENAEEYPEQAGHLIAWVTKKGRGKDIAPPVLDVDGTELLDPTEIYSGCYAKVSMDCFAYKFMNKRGTTFGLRAVKKVSDGERLGPVDNAASDFDDDDLI